MSIKYARTQAEKLVDRLGINSLPIKVEQVAKSLDLTVTSANLGDEVSGLLISDGTSAHVITHENDGPKRQRFTIAHEIGHYYLQHQFEAGEHVHVDRGHYISQRGPKASDGTDIKEIEANQFAASLLMPSKLVREKVTGLGGGSLLDHQVSQLAEMFEVSEQAMTIRLTTLGLL
ncbi:MAG: ImmA/IrrE family metallo-endopeptidase [Pyrinomonadaceae bacterium]